MNGNKLQVHATKKFMAKKLTLIPLTTMVSISTVPLKTPWIEVGKVECSGKDHTIYIKSGNTNIKGSGNTEATKKNEFMVKFWVVDAASTGDTRKANCEFSTCNTDINVGKVKIPLTFPTIVNTSVIQDEEVITVLSPDEPSDAAIGPANKRSKKK
jgi:hypothetical protein